MGLAQARALGRGGAARRARPRAAGGRTRTSVDRLDGSTRPSPPRRRPTATSGRGTDRTLADRVEADVPRSTGGRDRAIDRRGRAAHARALGRDRRAIAPHAIVEVARRRRGSTTSLRGLHAATRSASTVPIGTRARRGSPRDRRSRIVAALAQLDPLGQRDARAADRRRPGGLEAGAARDEGAAGEPAGRGDRDGRAALRLARRIDRALERDAREADRSDGGDDRRATRRRHPGRRSTGWATRCTRSRASAARDGPAGPPGSSSSELGAPDRTTSGEPDLRLAPADRPLEWRRRARRLTQTSSVAVRRARIERLHASHRQRSSRRRRRARGTAPASATSADASPAHATRPTRGGPS